MQGMLYNRLQFLTKPAASSFFVLVLHEFNLRQTTNFCCKNTKENKVVILRCFFAYLLKNREQFQTELFTIDFDHFRGQKLQTEVNIFLKQISNNKYLVKYIM